MLCHTNLNIPISPAAALHIENISNRGHPCSAMAPANCQEGHLYYIKLRRSRSVLPRLLLQGAAPCPLFVTPCPFKKSRNDALPSHTWLLAMLLPFLLPTHSVDCAVHLLLSHSRALLVSSAIFHPFTTLIMPFFFSSPC